MAVANIDSLKLASKIAEGLEISDDELVELASDYIIKNNQEDIYDKDWEAVNGDTPFGDNYYEYCRLYFCKNYSFRYNFPIEDIEFSISATAYSDSKEVDCYYSISEWVDDDYKEDHCRESFSLPFTRDQDLKDLDYTEFINKIEKEIKVRLNYYLHEK